MLIIPFIHTQIMKNKIVFDIIKILTIGGKTLWSEDNSLDIKHDILELNGIMCSNIKQIRTSTDNIYLCKVDINRTNIEDFYKWEEIALTDKDTFCWRKYIQFTENENDINWLDIPRSERIDKYTVEDIIQYIRDSEHK